MPAPIFLASGRSVGGLPQAKLGAFDDEFLTVLERIGVRAAPVTGFGDQVCGTGIGEGVGALAPDGLLIDLDCDVVVVLDVGALDATQCVESPGQQRIELFHEVRQVVLMRGHHDMEVVTEPAKLMHIDAKALQASEKAVADGLDDLGRGQEAKGAGYGLDRHHEGLAGDDRAWRGHALDIDRRTHTLHRKCACLPGRVNVFRAG